MVSVVGDGSFCFSGPQPLWTQARYKAPVLNIVLNNHSYNNERNRIWHYGGKQFRTGRDMTCYLGSPDIDYAKSSEAFGVEAEVVKEPGKLKGAIARAQRAMANHAENLILFAIAVVVVTLSDESTRLTATCAWLYVVARLLYVPAYVFGLAPVRSLVWGVGWVATLLMILAALF